MNKIYFSMQTKVYFERGGIARYLPGIKNYGKKVLLVSGKNFIFQTGLFEKINNICSRNGVSLVSYPEVNPEPGISDVERGAEMCRQEGCECVLGVGGGSAMDVAKAVSVLATNRGELKSYFGEVPYESQPLPVITIPTTCGTGSEVTRFAVIMDREAKTKKTVSSEFILPRISILDSEVLETLPYSLVIATGMDAFSHSAESFLSKKADYLSRMFSRESLGLLWRFLPQIKKDRDNTVLKEKIFLASLLAGLAINRTGTIIVHGIGYTLTVTRNTHHGTANALLLPYVFEYLKENGYQEEFNQLEEIWGDTGRLKDFVRGLGLPSSLSEIGIKKDDIDYLAELSREGTRRSLKNMKMSMGTKEYKEILSKAL